MGTQASAVTSADPPIPNRTTRIGPAPPSVVAHDNMGAGITAAICAAIGGGLFYFHHPVAGYILGGLALLFLSLIFAKKSDVGQCPYCMAMFRETVAVKDKMLRCEKCGEYSQVTGKIVRPMEATVYSDKPKFETAVFKQVSFPNACAACGAPATRIDNVSTSSIDKTLALLGAARIATGSPGLAVLRQRTASISVPYCALHKDAVALTLDWRKRPVLAWSSVRMMRRYLAVNRGKESY